MSKNSIWDLFINSIPLNIVDEEDFREYVESCGYEIDEVSVEELQNLHDGWVEANEMQKD